MHMKAVVAIALSIGLAGCALDMRRQDVSERIEMHAGSSWMAGVPVLPLGSMEVDENAAAIAQAAKKTTLKKSDDDVEADRLQRAADLEKVKQDIVYGREILLTPKELVLGDGRRANLFLVNQSLTCEPPAPDENNRWSCKPFVDLSLAIPTPGATLLKCLNFYRTQKTKANLVGVIDEKYCVLITLVERKRCGTNCSEKAKWHPTDISRDSLRIYVFDADYEGPGGAGAVVGGPRPNFITAPLTKPQSKAK